MVGKNVLRYPAPRNQIQNSPPASSIVGRHGIRHHSSELNFACIPSNTIDLSASLRTASMAAQRRDGVATDVTNPTRYARPSLACAQELGKVDNPFEKPVLCVRSF